MKPENQIIRAVCPMCKKKEMVKCIQISPINYKDNEKVETWRCPDCVYVYTEKWFNKFDQYEDFLLRANDNIGKFNKKFKDVLKEEEK